MSQSVTPVRTYLQVFAALMGFTALTVGAAHVNIARHLPGQLGDTLNDAAAMAIAVTKAALVILVFMGARGSTRVVRLVILTALLFLLILFSFTLADFFTRGWLGVPGK